MGYAINAAASIPLAIAMYVLLEKIIQSAIADRTFNSKVQTNFVIGFVLGLTMIALGMTVFAESKTLDNQIVQFAMYGAGIFFILNSVFFSWDILDEKTKIVILGLIVTGIVLWSYTNTNRFIKSKKID